MATSRFEVTTAGPAAVVVCSGDLTPGAVPELRTAVQRCIDDGAREVTIDLRGLEGVDPNAVPALSEVRDLIEGAGGTARLCVDEGVRGLLDSARTVMLFEAIDDALATADTVESLVANADDDLEMIGSEPGTVTWVHTNEAPPRGDPLAELGRSEGDGIGGDLVRLFADTAGSLYVSENLDEALGRLTAAAVHLIDGCDMASVSLVKGRELGTAGATDVVAQLGDQIQYQCGEGPCLEAATAQRLVYTPDLERDDRWPNFSRRVCTELEVRSMLACRLQVARETGPIILGALNLYALTADAFSDEDALVTVLLASHGAVVLDASARQASLRAAMESRDVIGQAKGILMERYRISDATAFDRLRTASQNMNRRLRDIAEALAETGEDPTATTAS
ncbi:MAG: ANTAR domain-containing protein [Actinobacteria bacterium]|nr:ANTAR domain-containing protein [Actinomycetota bacterium]MBV9662646.1 ANTAR domain-containing protein [Actinomycetota bacterium]